jgi:hypothetical protein
MTMATPPTSFATDIRPLFRAKDIDSMKMAFDLSKYEDVRSQADAILGRVAAGSMPCDGPWPQEQVDLFRRWVEEGLKP